MNKHKIIVDYIVDNMISNKDLDRLQVVITRLKLAELETTKTTEVTTKSKYAEKTRMTSNNNKTLNNHTKVIKNTDGISGTLKPLREVFGVKQVATVCNWSKELFAKLIDTGSIYRVMGTTKEDLLDDASHDNITFIFNNKRRNLK